jgi:4-diphosphocytidyl-2-C-methyl-D-erythritol kinase
LRKLENIPRYWFLLVCPDIKVSTKKVYEAYKQDLTKKKPGVKMIIRALRRSNMPEIGSVIYNDLEDTVKNMHKQVDQIKNHLKNEGVEAVLTSGSGPCIFGMFTLKEEAMRIAEKVQAEQKGWTLFTCCSRQNKLIV